MGVSAAGLALMALARAGGADFSRVVTIGRQGVHISSEDLQTFFRLRGRDDIARRIALEPGDGYCEHLLKVAFAASEVESVDASGYEQAVIVHDMNTPMAPVKRYSVVLDFGTLEHVFNVPVAFDNVAALCAEGGHVLHVLPCNNLSGHGFYQFSPGLFFQIYSPARGYETTRVFAAPDAKPDTWYEVHAPSERGARVNLTSKDQLYLLVLTRKTGHPVPLVQAPVQQSDYVHRWMQEPTPSRAARRRSQVERLISTLFQVVRHRRKVARRDIEAPRPDITPRQVLALTPQF
jgi:hypothetical protein